MKLFYHHRLKIYLISSGVRASFAAETQLKHSEVDIPGSLGNAALPGERMKKGRSGERRPSDYKREESAGLK